MRRKWITEEYGGEPYTYLPITEHIVNAKGVCNGRPTFKYTRIEPILMLSMMTGQGCTVDDILYHRPQLCREAIEEAQEAYLDGRLKRYNRNF